MLREEMISVAIKTDFSYRNDDTAQSDELTFQPKQNQMASFKTDF